MPELKLDTTTLLTVDPEPSNALIWLMMDSHRCGNTPQLPDDPVVISGMIMARPVAAAQN